MAAYLNKQIHFIMNSQHKSDNDSHTIHLGFMQVVPLYSNKTGSKREFTSNNP